MSGAQANGLATGVGMAISGSRLDVTREQVFTILNQALASLASPASLGALTVLISSATAPPLRLGRQHAATLVAYQIVGGDTDGNLNPQASLTRAEMAALLYKRPTIRLLPIRPRRDLVQPEVRDLSRRHRRPRLRAGGPGPNC